MPLLDCNVTSCFYNDSKLCSKNNILVAGDEACSSNSTCCDSFKARSMDSYSSNAGTAARPTNVDCEAVKCTYNENRLCHATQIGITGPNANQAEQTECSTFKPR